MAVERYGILVKLPENDPMSEPHLLGAEWSASRWYESESQRDEAFEKMQELPRYYRKGDSPSVFLTKITKTD